MKKLSSLTLITLLLLLSCEEEDPILVALNGGLETGTVSPDYWTASTLFPGFQLEWTDRESSSPTKSLSISRDVSHLTDFSYWEQKICNPMPVGKSLTLSARIKGNLTGIGVSIVIRADRDSTGTNNRKFVSTERQIPITGNFDWQTFQVTMTGVTTDTACITILLVYLTRTSGEVFFDDITLTTF